MDPITQQIALASAGAGGAGPLYVDDVFSTYLYDGTGAAQTITNGIDLSGEGGLVWVKGRDSAQDHVLQDTERGTSKILQSNATSANISSPFFINGFNSNGFDVSVADNVNKSGEGFCSWTFRKAPGFFDIVTWTGDGTTGRTVSHNLGSTPGMIIVKCLSNAQEWVVWHRSAGQYEGQLNQSSSFGFEYITGASSTNFTITYAGAATNQSGRTYIAYLFAHDEPIFGTDENESIIKCGSYTGNGSTSGPVVNLGFEPQWVMIKSTSSGTFANWAIFDNMRGVSSKSADVPLLANRFDPENGTYTPINDYISFTSTGFELEGPGYTVTDSASKTYIYIAIRRPHKPPESGTDVFNPSTQVGTVPNFAANFPVDFAIRLLTAGGNTTYSQMAVTRLTGEKFLATSQNNAEATPSGFSIDWDHMDGWGDLGGSGYGLSFKRAPGFFDVVAYTGTGSNRTVTHNLGVKPELMIVKNRENSLYSWRVYSETTDATDYLNLNTSGGASDLNTIWNDTEPTSSVFSVGTNGGVNGSGEGLVAYLFASLSGISKVGSYSGTGSNVDVDCGFTAGARFVLIKRTDSTGDWYVWDSTRGIVSGNDPYILLNSTAAQVTNTDYLDPLNAGFTVTSSAPAALNASGGTYLFLAIA